MANGHQDSVLAASAMIKKMRENGTLPAASAGKSSPAHSIEASSCIAATDIIWKDCRGSSPEGQMKPRRRISEPSASQQEVQRAAIAASSELQRKLASNQEFVFTDIDCCDLVSSSTMYARVRCPVLNWRIGQSGSHGFVGFDNCTQSVEPGPNYSLVLVNFYPCL